MAEVATEAPTTPDRRLTPLRSDVAAEKLREVLDAPRYAAPQPHLVLNDRVALRRHPDPADAYDTVLLYGEPFDVYDTTDGWAWGQSGLDDYVGYLPAASLSPAPDQPKTHIVRMLGCQLYQAPSLKLPPVGVLPFAARVRVTQTQDDYAQLASGAWAPLPLLRPLDRAEPDWVGVAERFLGVPYVWGGRSSGGVDCSGLVQLALQAAGQTCPRDSDMQEAALGEDLAPTAPLDRGDLIFWRGHVGVMLDEKVLLHANAHHMAVAKEPLAQAVARISDNGDGEITRRARLDAAFNPA